MQIEYRVNIVIALLLERKFFQQQSQTPISFKDLRISELRAFGLRIVSVIIFTLLTLVFSNIYFFTISLVRKAWSPIVS